MGVVIDIYIKFLSVLQFILPVVKNLSCQDWNLLRFVRSMLPNIVPTEKSLWWRYTTWSLYIAILCILVLSLACLAGLSDADSSNFPHSKAESKLFSQSKNQCKMSLCKRTRILEGCLWVTWFVEGGKYIKNWRMGHIIKYCNGEQQLFITTLFILQIYKSLIMSS